MRICKVEDCDSRLLAKGLCVKHYERYRKYGDVNYVKHARHGMKKSSEYGAWHSMKTRCYNENSEHYHRYGGRGITVCDRWLHSFKNFHNDMGPKPFPKAQIDRKENDKGYYKSNCRWTTCAINNQNRSDTKLTMEIAELIRKEYREIKTTQALLAKKYGVSNGFISRIINNKAWKV